MTPDFLGVADILRLHRRQIELFGGTHEIRDVGLLQSAIGAPQASFGGAFLHEDIFEMAAAYLYSIVNNHPFVDGNKRTAAAAAIVFLSINGWECEVTSAGLADITLDAATGTFSRKEVAVFLRENSRSL